MAKEKNSRLPGPQPSPVADDGLRRHAFFELDAAVSPDGYLRRLKLIRPAVNLGGIETTICSPAKTSHAKKSVDERKRIGVTDALLRLSVGIEHVDDLVEDQGQAME